MRRLGSLVAVLLVVAPGGARAEANIVTKVTARADGSKTVVTVRGSATPSFTAYRLERPSRLVLDLAGGRFDPQVGEAGPMDVDTFAVSQIATAQYADEATRTARVMIGLKRPATYDVRAKGHEVIVTITPDEAPPKAALDGEAAKRRAEAEAKANAAAAAGTEAARREAEAALRKAEREQMALLQKTEQLKLEARALETQRERALKEAQAEAARREAAQAEAKRLAAEAQAQVQAARRQAEEARARAQAARAELDQIAKARAQEAGRAQAEKEKSAQEVARAQAETARVRAEREREQARLEALRAEAEALVKARELEAKRLAEAQAQARKLAEAKAARLEEARKAAERRALDSDAARVAEERKLQAQAEEARRLAGAAEAAKQAAASEAARRQAEERARAAAAAAEKELARVERARAEAHRLAAGAQAARLEVNRQRAEIDRLLTLQRIERERLHREQKEARRLADKRADEAARAAHAAALASQSTAKLEAAERDARKVAEARAKESDRLEQARAKAQAQAQKRAEELKELERARAEAQKQVAARAAELEALDARRRAEEQKLKAAQAALEAQVKEQSKLRAERTSLNEELVQVKHELEAAKRQRAEKASPPVVKVAATTTVHDVRFADEERAARVIVDLGADAQYTVLRAEPKTAVLRIAGAALPKKLERTLDVEAYKGPVRRISSYVDPNDPGAVRVVVTVDGEVEPKVVKDGTRLAWEFPKREVKSYPPQRVGGYQASVPLVPASAPAAVSAGLPMQTANIPGAPARRRQVYTGRRISLDFKDIDIHNVLRLLADVGQVNIVTSDDVKGTVTIRMVDVPWDQALDVILKAKGLGMQREGNLIRVAPAAQLEKELEAEIARAKAAVELKPLDTRLIPLSYADAQKMMARVQDVLSPRGKVSVDERTNMLIVSDVAGNIALAEDLVRNLDTQTPQVLIESRIVEARTTFLRTIGIQWGGNTINSAATGNPTGLVFPSTIGAAGGSQDILTAVNSGGLQLGAAASPNYVVNLPAPVGTGSGGALGMQFGAVNGNVNINLRLSSLENTGDVRIISAPKITTMDNVEAQIEQGVAIPISVVSAAGTNTVFVDAKLNLTVKPHVTNEGSVIMNVHITRNEPDFVNTGARGDPTILKKQARTEMLVRDGDTAVIGGIYTRNTGMSYNKVPWFAEIPVLGWLFKNRRENDDRTELLIFITPRVVNRQALVRR